MKSKEARKYIGLISAVCPVAGSKFRIKKRRLSDGFGVCQREGINDSDAWAAEALAHGKLLKKNNSDRRLLRKKVFGD